MPGWIVVVVTFFCYFGTVFSPSAGRNLVNDVYDDDDGDDDDNDSNHNSGHQARVYMTTDIKGYR